MSIELTYTPIYAMRTEDFGQCFYCGCEATAQDYVPPLQYAEFYDRHYGGAPRMIVPSCYECYEFLRGAKKALIEERHTIVKASISVKYKKALRIFRSWQRDELGELSVDLRKSIDSGIVLGEEAYQRLQYPGFSYEYEGHKNHSIITKAKVYQVYGQSFDSLRDALLFISRSYRINIHKLEDLFQDADGDIEKAVDLYFEEVKAAELEKQLKDKCLVFSVKYSQSQGFVEKTVRVYLGRYSEVTVDWCLEKILEDKAKRTAQQ